MPPPFAELVDVTYRDPQGRAVLDGVSLTFERGAATALIGHAGSGKTTALRLLLGQVAPTAGRVLVGGLDLARASYAEQRDHRTRTGYAFEGAGLWSNRTLFDNVALALAYHSPAVGRPSLEARVVGLASELGIADRLNLRPYEVNASVRKRALVARALVLEPPLLLCDEPHLGLVFEEAELVERALARRRAERQLTVVLADHDGRLEPFTAERRWCLEAGGVVDRPSALPPPRVRDSFMPVSASTLMGRPL